MAAILRFASSEGGPRLGVMLEGIVYDVSAVVGSLSDWLLESGGDVPGAIQFIVDAARAQPPAYSYQDLLDSTAAGKAGLLAPVERQEVWAAGVTYERSRAARQEEALDGGDVYARVYTAERPELFFKSYGEKVVGPGKAVGIRRDARWSVPEPELAVLFNPALEVVGFCIGNDLSSRDIEGANPLYLPQAKIYTASCGLGPIVELSNAKEWPEKRIRMWIERGGEEIFSGETHTQRIHRSLADLVEYLGRCSQFPYGAVLLTGTGIIPPLDFGLQAGDTVHIEIEGIGRLSNPVQIV
jgi:2-dehydro-3-deoxy-D-arabinonate dehydratase